MLPMKQAIDKPMGQNLFGERGWIFPPLLCSSQDSGSEQ